MVRKQVKNPTDDWKLKHAAARVLKLMGKDRVIPDYLSEYPKVEHEILAIMRSVAERARDLCAAEIRQQNVYAHGMSAVDAKKVIVNAVQTFDPCRSMGYTQPK